MARIEHFLHFDLPYCKKIFKPRNRDEINMTKYKLNQSILNSFHQKKRPNPNYYAEK